MTKEFYHTCTDEITCPHCGYEFSDSWEYSDSDCLQCIECEEVFSMERDVSVSYSTRENKK